MDTPKLLWNDRLGGIGESEIKKRLQYFSNPTKYEKDIGLDFYCELLENGSPSIPFYIQAKGTEHFDNKWGQSIEKSTITYWLQQESPVFLIVYDENEGQCFWMSIEDKRYEFIEKIFNTNSKTIYVTMDKSNILETGKNTNFQFLEKIKEDWYLVKMFRGQAQFIGNDYVKKIPPAPKTLGVVTRLKTSVRAGLYSLVQHFAAVNDFEPARKCCEFLVEFDKEHFNHFLWLGKMLKETGDKEKAKKYLGEALKICLADKNWPKESMDPITELIKKEMEEL